MMKAHTANLKHLEQEERSRHIRTEMSLSQTRLHNVLNEIKFKVSQ